MSTPPTSPLSAAVLSPHDPAHGPTPPSAPVALAPRPAPAPARPAPTTPHPSESAILPPASAEEASPDAPAPAHLPVHSWTELDTTPDSPSVLPHTQPVTQPLTDPVAPPHLPGAPAPSPTTTDEDLASAQEEGKAQAKQRRYTFFDDVYITRFAGDTWVMRVTRDPEKGVRMANYYAIPTADDWVPQVLTEISTITRARATIRIHTKERELTQAVRELARADTPHRAVRSRLNDNGKKMILARPERESPLWRGLFSLMEQGRLPTVNPLTTFAVYTAAITDHHHVYSGVVMIGLGTILVHQRHEPGDNLTDAELNMMQWVIEHAGGGSRLDIYHSSQLARRIWDEADSISIDQHHPNAPALIRLLKQAIARNITVRPGHKPNPVLDRYARYAATDAYTQLPD